MTQEEKVRAYDKALSVALETYKTQPMYRDWLEKMFPELKESENEMVRKALINGFNKLDKSAVWYNGITNAQVLDWLERQGEHANFRKKIQIGDKVTRNEDGMLVNLSQLNRVAKVEEKQVQKPTDEEIKKLLRTEYEKGRADAIAEMQKSWSEEDEEHIKSLLERLEGMCKKDATFIRTKFAISEDEDWLKSISPQSRWKPSNEQMNAFDAVLVYNPPCSDECRNHLITLYNELKKLKGE